MPSLIEYLDSQPLFKIIRSLLLSPNSRHLRDLAKEHKISVAGASDIIRRLKKAGVLQETRLKNKKLLSLKLSPEENTSLLSLFKQLENKKLEKRALKFSKGAKEKFEWMDDAYKFYRNVKKNGNTPINT